MERSGAKTGSGRGISPSVPPQKTQILFNHPTSVPLLAVKIRKIHKSSLYLGPFIRLKPAVDLRAMAGQGKRKKIK